MFRTFRRDFSPRMSRSVHLVTLLAFVIPLNVCLSYKQFRLFAILRSQTIHSLPLTNILRILPLKALFLSLSLSLSLSLAVTQKHMHILFFSNIFDAFSLSLLKGPIQPRTREAAMQGLFCSCVLL